MIVRSRRTRKSRKSRKNTNRFRKRKSYRINRRGYNRRRSNIRKRSNMRKRSNIRKRKMRGGMEAVAPPPAAEGGDAGVAPSSGDVIEWMKKNTEKTDTEVTTVMKNPNGRQRLGIWENEEALTASYQRWLADNDPLRPSLIKLIGMWLSETGKEGGSHQYYIKMPGRERLKLQGFFLELMRAKK